MIEEPYVVIHKADEPDFIAYFLHAHVLSGEDGTEIDFASTEADAATVGDDDGSVRLPPARLAELLISELVKAGAARCDGGCLVPAPA